MTIQVYKA